MLNLRAKDYRVKAAELVRDYRGLLALITLVVGVICSAVASLSTIGNAFKTVADGTTQAPAINYYSLLFSVLAVAGEIILLPFFAMGLVNICAKLREKKEIAFVDLFSGFRRETWNYVGANALCVIFLFLWSLLLIVPGIIKAYSYSMVPYIYKDNPTIDNVEAITKSRRMMDGNKWKLFCLQFSYIGWFLLVGLTCGILSLWVLPRYEQAMYEFYCNVSGKNDVPYVEAETTVEA